MAKKEQLTVIGIGDIVPVIDLVTDVSGLNRTDAPASAAMLGAVRKDVYDIHSEAVIWANPNTIETGASTEVTIGWAAKFKGTVVTAVSTKITNKAGTVVSTAANNQAKQTLTAGETFKIETVVVDGITKSATVDVVAVYPMYFGGAAAATLDGAGVTALVKQAIKRSPNGDYSVAVKNGDYMWLCVPSTMTINKVKSGGFDVPMEAAKTVAVTGKGDYKCYRSASTLPAQTVNISIS